MLLQTRRFLNGSLPNGVERAGNARFAARMLAFWLRATRKMW